MCEKCKEVEELIKYRLQYFRECPSHTEGDAYWYFVMLANIEKILAKTDKEILIERGVIKNGG